MSEVIHTNTQVLTNYASGIETQIVAIQNAQTVINNNINTYVSGVQEQLTDFQTAQTSFNGVISSYASGVESHVVNSQAIINSISSTSSGINTSLINLQVYASGIETLRQAMVGTNPELEAYASGTQTLTQTNQSNLSLLSTYTSGVQEQLTDFQTAQTTTNTNIETYASGVETMRRMWVGATILYGLATNRPDANTLNSGTLWFSLDTGVGQSYYVYRSPEDGAQSWQQFADYPGAMSSHLVSYTHNDIAATKTRVATAERNLALINLQLQATGSLARQEMEDGFTDTFIDTSGVSSYAGATYTPVSHKFASTYSSPTYGATFLSGNATASSYNITNYPIKACDANETTYWQCVDVAPNWWKCDLGTGVTKTARKFRIKNYATREVEDFTLLGSNNDSDWTTITTGTCATGNDWQEFTFSNTTAYRYYKVTVDSHYYAAAIWVYEMELLEVTVEGGYSNITVQSTPVTAEAIPTYAQTLFLIEPINPISINSNVKGYVSRNDGQAWTELTLGLQETFSTTSGIRLYSSDQEITSSSGVAMRVKLATTEEKGITLHGWGLLWR